MEAAGAAAAAADDDMLLRLRWSVQTGFEIRECELRRSTERAYRMPLAQWRKKRCERRRASGLCDERAVQTD